MTRSMNYTAIGDSLTEGIGALGKENNFVEIFFRYVRKTSSCQVFNLGKSGMVSQELLDQLKTNEQVRSIIRPSDIVTVSIGGNDLIEATQVSFTLTDIFQSGERMIRNVAQILQMIRDLSPNAHIFLLGLYTPNVPNNPWMPAAGTFLKRFNRRYEEVANEAGVKMINPFNLLSSNPCMFADEIHPNNEGYALIAQKMIEAYELLCSCSEEILIQPSLATTMELQQ